MGEFAEDKFLIREVCGPSIRGLVGERKKNLWESAGLARRPALLLRVVPKDDNSLGLLSN